MKIEINYDLIDRIAEAKKGFSLKRCAKRPIFLTSIATGSFSMVGAITGDSIYHTASWIISAASFYTFQSVLMAMLLRKEMKKCAEKDLRKLVAELRNSTVKTDEEAILDSYKYETQYKIKADDSFLPKIEEKKYIKVPIQDEYWGNKEMPIVQEHIVGSSDYTISIGTPEQKVYKLGFKTMLGK